ncbi:MAG: membrane-bound lytic murein transglycosylase MltF [Gammaproteobacteria bacterium]|nr:membrane-bound lytic murein transglycosylase MltF [Gammaproteobacteria bacterium]
MTADISFAINTPMDTLKYTQRFAMRINYRIKLIWACALVYLVTGCQPAYELSQLQKIKQSDVLRVGILFNPTSYYVDTNGTAGFEHDLVNEFANYLDVEIELIPSYHISELLPKLENNQIDILVGGLTRTESRSDKFRFSPPYLNISQKLVYKQGKQRPTKLSEVDGVITVAPETSHLEILEELKEDYPDLQFEVSKNADPNELLEMIIDGSVEFTIADSHNLSIVRRYFPDISVAFTLEKSRDLNWLLQNNRDDSLYAILIDFFGDMNESGELIALEDRYFGHVEKFNYVDTRLFMKAVDQVLPTYQPWFEEYASGLDWRLLAAQSYQESHWDPRAKSPTGVRGIMMLTQPTAKQLGVKSRLDAEDNIRGGAVYLQQLMRRVPDRISEHDRPWFALAAYNVGWGHVQDARRLTSQLGGDPDKWVDVKQKLPLLRQKRYYKKTRYGFARGDEAVTYVSNIRRYYDTLVWLDQKATEEEIAELRREEAQKPAIPEIAQ